MTVLSHTEDRGTRAFTAQGRTDSARVFRSASRHSRLVRLLRVVIPGAVVAALVGTFLAATVLDPLRALSKLPVDIGALVVSGTKITTQGPRYAGYTQDKRPYVVTARSAAQDVTKPGIIELNDLHAKMTMKDGGEVDITGRTGLFESKADLLKLYEDILVTSATYQARLIEATVNVRSNHVVSERPVEVTMRQGVVNGNRLEVTDSGEMVRFERGVTMVLKPESKAGTQSAPPNAFGFSGNGDKPVTIKATSLEVRDKQKFATFSGNVHVVQGDTEMRSKVLVVFYEDATAPAGAATAQSAPAQGALGGNNQIKRMEATGGVVVTQKDQVANGERGDFDMRSNVATLTGNVVVTKGQDEIRGQKMTIHLDTGVSRVEGGKGPIEMMVMPKQNPAAPVGSEAGVQPPGPPNAMQGFSANRDKPVAIKATSLEVRDKQKFATFSGNVRVVQGDTEMRCKVLVVYYEDAAGPAGAAAAQGGLGDNNQIKRMEAKGGVVVTQKDQIVTGDRADFDMKTNVATLTNNVVVTRGQDVIRGQKLLVHLDTGASTMEAGSGARMEMLINPKQGPGQMPGPAAASQASAQGQNPTQNQGKSARPARPN